MPAPNYGFSIKGYIDAYYGYFTGALIPNSRRMPLLVSYNRHNEMNINLAFVDLQYKSERIRARFVPAFGNYMTANYPQNANALRNIMEANIGYKLFKNREIWLEAGIFGAPYTNESPVSQDQLMYTRSMSSELSPYYLSGAKLGIPLGKKWNADIYVINGWQLIQENNEYKSLGTHLEFKLSPKHSFNLNTYIGNEGDSKFSSNQMRYFSDFYWIYNPEGKFTINSCLYYGIQQFETIGINGRNLQNREWYQANFNVRYRLNSNHFIAARIEYFKDEFGIVTQSDFSRASGSICYSFRLAENAMFRLEARQFRTGPSKLIDIDAQKTNQLSWLVCGATIKL